MKQEGVDELPVPIDLDWFNRFRETNVNLLHCASGEKGYRDEQKKLFLSGKIDNPTLDYPYIPDNLGEMEAELLLLKNDIIMNEENYVIEQAYRWRINEKIAQLRLIQAIKDGNMNRFRRYSNFLYGKPSKEIFSYFVNNVHDTIEQAILSGNEDLVFAAQDLRSVLPDAIDIGSEFDLPTSENIKLLGDRTKSELGELVVLPEGLENVDAEGIQEAFEIALEILKAHGWIVVINEDNSKTGISVSQEEKIINIPADRKVTISALADLIIHEVGTHVKRSVMGERTKLLLLSLGLDRYTRAEEGLSVAREQAIEGFVKRFAGISGFLAIGFALGLDGTPRDFRGTYEIMYKYFLFSQIKSGKSLESARIKAQTAAWNRCIRTFRGTDCKTKGVALTNDMVYTLGNIGTWGILRDYPEEMMRFSIGKYDPANPGHIWILTALGITDEDLGLK